MTEERNEERLRGLLEIVEEIKAEHYVGTKEAFKLAKARERIRNTPQELTAFVNGELGEVAYRATPVRIAGLSTLIDTAVEIAYNAYTLPTREEYSNLRGEIDAIRMEDHLLGNADSLHNVLFEEIEGYEEKDISRDFIVSVFKVANARGVRDDYEFKEFVRDEITDSLTGIENLPDEQEDEQEFYTTPIIQEKIRLELGLKDEEDVFSNDNLSALERGANLRAKLYSCTLQNQTARLKNDCLEMNREYRKRLLADYLEIRYRERLPGYGKIVDDIELRMRETEERIEILTSHVLLGIVKGTRAQLMARLSLAENKKNLSIDKYIRHIIGSEKNFLIGFLEN